MLLKQCALVDKSTSIACSRCKTFVCACVAAFAAFAALIRANLSRRNALRRSRGERCEHSRAHQNRTFHHQWHHLHHHHCPASTPLNKEASTQYAYSQVQIPPHSFLDCVRRTPPLGLSASIRGPSFSALSLRISQAISVGSAWRLNADCDCVWFARLPF